MTDTAPVLTVSDDPQFVERDADNVRTIAAVKPALVRLLEWHLDRELDRASQLDRVLCVGEGSGSEAVQVRLHDGHW